LDAKDEHVMEHREDGEQKEDHATQQPNAEPNQDSATYE
jgi:hypothetical protein